MPQYEKCAAGHMCNMPSERHMAEDRHVCPECFHNVHAFCGKEDESRSIKHRTTCFLCIEQYKKGPANESYRINLDDRLSTVFTNTPAAAASKRAPDKSLSVDSDDDDVVILVPPPIADLSTNSVSTGNNNSALSKNDKSKPRAKKRGKKSDSLLVVKDQFLSFDRYYISPNTGNETPHKAGLCLHCKNTYDQKMIEPGVFRPKPPVEMGLYAAPMARHLKKCAHYRKALLMAQKSDGIGPSFSTGMSQSSISPVTMPGLSSDQTSSATAAVCSQCSCSCKGKRNQGSVLGHYLFPLTAAQVSSVNSHLIEMLVDCAIPFRVVDRTSFRELVDKIRPGVSVQLPSRSKVKDLLIVAASDAQEQVNACIELELKKGHKAGMVVDTWSNVNKIHVEGVLITLGSQSFMLESVLSGYKHHGIAVAKGWQCLLMDTYPQYTFHYFCSDDAGQCGRARRILALRFPFIIFNRCWAHQINLMVKSLLQRSQFRKTCEQAIRTSNSINASSSKWLPQLKNICESFYGKRVPTAVFAVGETRWNSTQACFASLLRIRSAFESLAITHRNALQDKPDLLSMSNFEFWVRLEEAELLIRPFCDASFLMQRESNTMADVVLVLLNLYRHVSEYCGDSEDARDLLVDIEKRWLKEENPLFFLTFALHPAYRRTASLLLDVSLITDGNWRTDRNYFSISRLVTSAKFYFGKFELLDNSVTNERKNNILMDLDDLVQKWLKNLPLDILPYKDGTDPVDWWMRQRDEFPSIAALAMFLLDAPVQSASCERLFKEFSRFHTKGRNRLHPRTTHMMAQVKYRLRRRYNDENLRIDSETKRSTNRFISPIEHTRTDTPQSPQPSSLCNNHYTGDVADLATEDMSVSSKADSDYSSDSIPGTEEDIFQKSDDDNIIQRWDKVLEASIPDESDDGNIVIEEDEAQFLLIDSNEIECFEKRRLDLPLLPDDNDPKYPQEDNMYFKRKKQDKYVRTDKYTLSRLYLYCAQLPENEDFPSIMSVYSKVE